MDEPRQAAKSAQDDPLTIRAGTTVAGAGLLLAGMILLSRVTGVARMVVIAHLFGQSAATDCYVSAFNIPDFIYFLISGGALATGFVPVFTEYLAEGQREAARRTFQALLTLLAVVLLVVIGLCYAFAPQLVYLIFPGYRQQPDMLALTTKLTRIVLPAQFFFVLGGLFSGTLNSLRYFFVPAVQPLLYNAGIITSGLLLGDKLGVASLSWGALVGAGLGCFGVQIPLLVKKGISFRPYWDLRDPGLRKVLSLVLPIILGLSITQITAILLPRSFASGLGEAATTTIENANRLMQLPVAVFASGLAIALLPSLSLLAAQKRHRELGKGIGVAFRAVLLLTLPSAALLIALRVPIIELLLEHGDFTPHHTALVAHALLFYVPAIPAMGTQQVVSRGFYALQDTRTPVVIGFCAIAVFCLVSYAAVPSLRQAGLALGCSVAAIVNAFLLLAVLAKRLPALEDQRDLVSGLSCAFASVVCGLVAHGAQLLTATAVSGSGLMAELVRVFVPLSVAVLSYGLLLVAFRVPEVKLVGQLLAARLAPWTQR